MQLFLHPSLTTSFASACLFQPLLYVVFQLAIFKAVIYFPSRRFPYWKSLPSKLLMISVCGCQAWLWLSLRNMLVKYFSEPQIILWPQLAVASHNPTLKWKSLLLHITIMIMFIIILLPVLAIWTARWRSIVNTFSLNTNGPSPTHTSTTCCNKFICARIFPVS